MCVSKELSFSSGLISYSIAYYLWQRNINYDKWLAISIICISSIQWAEGFLWMYFDNIPINTFITSFIIPIILISEFIGSLYGATLYTNVNQYLIYFYIIVALIFAYTTIHQKTSTIVDGSLAWTLDTNILYGVFFLIMLVMPFILYMDDPLMVFVFVFTAAFTLFYSYYINKETWHSRWCFYAIIVSIVALIRPTI